MEPVPTASLCLTRKASLMSSMISLSSWHIIHSRVDLLVENYHYCARSFSRAKVKLTTTAVFCPHWKNHTSKETRCLSQDCIWLYTSLVTWPSNGKLRWDLTPAITKQQRAGWNAIQKRRIQLNMSPTSWEGNSLCKEISDAYLGIALFLSELVKPVERCHNSRPCHHCSALIGLPQKRPASSDHWMNSSF